jgi:ATP-dependent Clp protease ATP-binding subunit ClpA
VFGDENACIRFDMSEYNHEHSDQRLVGAPPGYVGYEAGGQLTNAVKEKPFCVLLFDEIEKAHGRILDKFLQILEDGRLTDGKGETVYFSETIIIFTSNIGAAEVNPNMEPKQIKAEFVKKVQDHFITKLGRPELLNRIGDNIVAFNFIDDPSVFTKIAKIKFKTIEDFVLERYGARIEFEDEDGIFMAIGQKAGKQNGGRGLLNVMETVIINPLSEFIFNKSDKLRAKTIVIKFEYPDRPDVCMFDFDLK